jgi:hypothetical protein
LIRLDELPELDEELPDDPLSALDDELLPSSLSPLSEPSRSPLLYEGAPGIRPTVISYPLPYGRLDFSVSYIETRPEHHKIGLWFAIYQIISQSQRLCAFVSQVDRVRRDTRESH